jgi:hypothetical protein
MLQFIEFFQLVLGTHVFIYETIKVFLMLQVGLPHTIRILIKYLMMVNSLKLLLLF